MGETVTHLYKGTNWEGDDYAVCGRQLDLKDKFTNDLLETTCKTCVIKEGKKLLVRQGALCREILKKIHERREHVDADTRGT